LKQRFHLLLVLGWGTLCFALPGCGRRATPPAERAQPAAPGELAAEQVLVHFLDVGQGDAALVQTPDGKNVLIDGGDSEAGEGVVAYLRELGVASLDLVIATHAHEDHLGGLIDVLREVPVKAVLDSGYAHGTATQQEFLRLVAEKGTPLHLARAGDRIKAGAATLEVLAPEEPLLEGTESDVNNNSVVVRLVYGDTAFLFAGDMEEAERERLLQSGQEVRSDVLKVAHHGSRNGTDPAFVAAVRPQIAVISCAARNDYGHPHKQALQALRRGRVHVYATDENGTVVVASDGQRVAVQPSRGGEFIAGPKLRSEKPKEPAETKPLPPRIRGGDGERDSPKPAASTAARYIGHRQSKVFHRPDCPHLPAQENRVSFHSREEAVEAGFRPCGNCEP